MTENTAEISLEALQAGDRVEFARLVDVYSTPVYRLALKMLGNAQDAEDVLQGTFLKAFQHILASRAAPACQPGFIGLLPMKL